MGTMAPHDLSYRRVSVLFQMFSVRHVFRRPYGNHTFVASKCTSFMLHTRSIDKCIHIQIRVYGSRMLINLHKTNKK